MGTFIFRKMQVTTIFSTLTILIVVVNGFPNAAPQKPLNCYKCKCFPTNGDISTCSNMGCGPEVETNSTLGAVTQTEKCTLNESCTSLIIEENGVTTQVSRGCSNSLKAQALEKKFNLTESQLQGCHKKKIAGTDQTVTAEVCLDSCTTDLVTQHCRALTLGYLLVLLLE